MRELPRMVLTMFLIAAFVSTSLVAGADKEEQQNARSLLKAATIRKLTFDTTSRQLEVYVKELEKAEEADRRTNPKYAEEVGYLETRRRLMAATVEDFEMGRASTDDYRRASEELAELELQSITRHQERLKAARANVERMTELAKMVKARMDAGTTGEREMLEGKAAQENAERQLRAVQLPETHSALEVSITQRAAEPLLQHYRNVSALTEVAAKGGEPDKQAEAGRAYYRSLASVAMAKGQPAEALSALRGAAVFADRALTVTKEAFDMGSAKPSDVIAAAKAREDSFRQYWEAYRVFGDPRKSIELPDDPFFEGLRVKQAAK